MEGACDSGLALLKLRNERIEVRTPILTLLKLFGGGLSSAIETVQCWEMLGSVQVLYTHLLSWGNA